MNSYNDVPKCKVCGIALSPADVYYDAELKEYFCSFLCAKLNRQEKWKEKIFVPPTPVE